MQILFKNKTIIVTGGTRGIGKQIASDFLELGGNVIVTGTSSELSENLKHPNLNYQSVDFQSKESLNDFIKYIESIEKIEVCVNNAGINRINFLENTLDRDWDDMQSVNVRAPFFITRAVSKRMKENKYGRIVNIASIFGSVSREKRSIYTMTKYAIRGLTVSASNELAKYNILINTVSPGFVITDLTKRNLSELEIKHLEEQIPMRRLAKPEEIAKVVLFLSSDYNTYITGQNIIVDGGFLNV
ncbi:MULTISPECIES: SDR family NAD(P)-dependent oxidoreductase [Leptospira]|uniref:KR domain protein n=1 Tax=Leptospira borgpetersenii serovar Javanica str. UI 09931 TaxID=1049767 RepID=A0AAV3J815_LEPBO|nr:MULTISPECIES: SDR family oxidoreductase [Leptospira]AXX16222.1 SDR family oxidoreductase [Leptospira borgpetersenii serovar Ceylonica]EKQ90426.1 KR domain protein [Leptospira borgpetersenii str. UI 09149]EKR00695.1 KR domain protein [Leptospira borgpetersenii serovar Castellonis str. 200801910]EMK08867.1 KR domain protein [Leptospira sp. serovar Kenya str. Sh9]EMN58480.1 KR domain protein [Leptospira borgpetersenii serovar Javanica str. MK146]